MTEPLANVKLKGYAADAFLGSWYGLIVVGGKSKFTRIVDFASLLSNRSTRYRGCLQLDLLLEFTFPLILPGVISGRPMSFIIGQRELADPLMVKPPGVETTATFIFSEFDQGNTSMAMAMSLVVVPVTVSVLMLLKVLETKHRIQTS